MRIVDTLPAQRRATRRRSTHHHEPLHDNESHLDAELANASCSSHCRRRSPAQATAAELMQAVAQLAREQLSQRWVADPGARTRGKARRVYYLSMEFLIGPHAGQRAGRAGPAATAPRPPCRSTRSSWKTWPSTKPTRRWATAAWAGWRRVSWTRWPRSACPPSATASATNTACSRRTSQNGRQVEYPDPWLADGTPWEFPRAGISYPVRFGGWVEHQRRQARCGATPARWPPRPTTWWCPATAPTQVSTLRLWKAAAPAHIDLHAFNTGDYARAAEVKNEYENISWVLYPNDSTPAGRELRLRQEYFFVSASMQDIVGRHLRGARHAGQPGRQGGDPPERHPPGHRRGRADARCCATSTACPGPTAWALTQQVFSLHQPHADARGAGDLAGGADAARAAAPPGDHLPHQPGVPRLRRAAPARRHGLPAPAVADRRTRRAPRAHGQPVDRRQPQGQRRVGAALRAAGEDHLRRLRQPVARALHQHDQRRHAAALAGAGQPGPGRAARPHASAAAGGSTWTSCSALRAAADDAAFRDEFMAIKRANKERLAEHIAAQPPASRSTRPACSTCRSSASTSTSASCSTCCTW